jgi:hypothetical protein
LRIGNGLRSAVTALLPVFAVGVYVWIGPAGGPWRLVGLLGLSTVPVLGLAANSAGSIAFWRIESLSEQPELATMLWSITVVYFFALYVPYSVGVVGFSLAGRASARMPKWLWILGLAFGSIGLASVLAINLVVADDRIAGAALSAYLLFLVWLVGVSVVMLRTRGFLPATASASQPNSGD